MAARHDPQSMLWIIEAFSVITGAIFVFSAIMNAITFALLWQINYFVIATTSDVVMGAFQATFYVLLFIGFFYLMDLADSHAVLGSPHQRRIKGGEPSTGDTVDKDDDAKSSESDAKPTKLSRLGHSPAKLIRLAFVGALAPVLMTAIYQNNGHFLTGLRLERGLQNIPCSGATVLWMGSDTMILSCGGDVRVVSRSDDIILKQKYKVPRLIFPFSD